ncbi:TPA: DUF6527 family protein [Vibrio vulnificus]|uniref:DUF6527 family protein n=1 Tax=Vibrio sp. V42_P2S4T144 TaxID=1938693 RepID=UPI00192A151C
MSNKVDPVVNGNGDLVGYMADCVGCGIPHVIYVANPNGGPTWTFNESLEKPTFSPSLLVTWDEGEERIHKRCHSFIVNGQWQYLNDCTHDLAGKTVDMALVEED